MKSNISLGPFKTDNWKWHPEYGFRMALNRIWNMKQPEPATSDLKISKYSLHIRIPWHLNLYCTRSVYLQIWEVSCVAAGQAIFLNPHMRGLRTTHRADRHFCFFDWMQFGEVWEIITSGLMTSKQYNLDELIS